MRHSIFIAFLVVFLSGCQDKLAQPESTVTKPTIAKTQPKTDPVAPPEPDLPGIVNPDRALTQTLRAKYLAKGKAYEPRTHHKDAKGQAKYTNRLITQTSPYLLQHAHNPVNWYPWSEEAFQAAKALGRPVLLSVGYSTCHWCHVMERESFENNKIASYINANFIAIKVDREERPDIDDVYMKAVRVMSGRGGWPMTVVMTPEKAPFFGGTYFPANDGDRGSRKGFSTILRELKTKFEADPKGVTAQAKNISVRMARMSRAMPAGAVPATRSIYETARQLHQNFDPNRGGFGRAPKFPLPSRTDLMLRYARRTGDPQALVTVTKTLEEMSKGGIYDQLGGGFHRYSVDARWLVPHFEKMLYDNAQLVTLYADAYQMTRRPDFARIVRQTLDYLVREMRSPVGGFYSATDADSLTPKKHMEEGYFFTWTPTELTSILGKHDAMALQKLMNVSSQGNFEGRSILHLQTPLEQALKANNLTMDTWKKWQHLLYQARAKRPAPLRDDKILVGWNGLTISAFSAGARVFGDKKYMEIAQNAATFILGTMRREDGVLVRSYKDGATTNTAFLDDYAFLIQGLLDLYEVSQQTKWLSAAIELQTKQDALFLDQKDGVYFMTAHDNEELILRDKPMYDGAVPSGNSISTMNLLRFYTLTTKTNYKKQAERLLGRASSKMYGGAQGLTRMLAALDFYHDRVPEIVLITPSGVEDALYKSPLGAVIARTYLPNKALSVMVAQDKRHQTLVPYAAKKPARQNKLTAYVCEYGRCELPTNDPATFAKQLDKIKPYGQTKPLVSRQ